MHLYQRFCWNASLLVSGEHPGAWEGSLQVDFPHAAFRGIPPSLSCPCHLIWTPDSGLLNSV